MAYTKKQKEEVFENILERIAEKGEALRTILSDKDMPSSRTFFKWLEENNGVDEDGNETESEEVKRYMRATRARADRIFDEMIFIADDGSKDMTTIFSKSGESYDVEDREVTNRSKLKIETRKWVLAKMNPKKYGDKQEITLEGGENPITISFKD